MVANITAARAVVVVSFFSITTTALLRYARAIARAFIIASRAPSTAHTVCPSLPMWRFL
jgi:hypothetical protein